VRFLQPAQLSLADAEQGTADNHSDSATAPHSKTGNVKRVAFLGGITVEQEKAIANSSCNHERRPNNQDTSGYVEPDFRSLHTCTKSYPLLKRGPCRAWHNLNTGIV
jgi:hypothetical protein